MVLVLCYRKDCSNELFCVISNDAKKQINHSTNETGLLSFDKYFIKEKINCPRSNQRQSA